MKKISILFLATLSLITLFACGNDEKSDVQSKKETSLPQETIESEDGNVIETDEVKNEKDQITEAEDQNAAYEEKNSYTIDGITVSSDTFSVEPFENAEGYTKRICVTFNFENNTDKAFGYISSCDGRLSDGYELKGWSDISSMSLNQIPSHSSKEVQMYLLADDTVDLEKINVSYDFMDYDQEYWDDFGKILTGDITQEEYEKKYGNKQELNFEVTLK